MDMAQSFQVAPEYVDEITFTTKVSSIEPNSGIDKYRRNQVSNQFGRQAVGAERRRSPSLAVKVLKAPGNGMAFL